ncbi:MAG: hypothetical protein ABI253_12455, partial [Mycobacterium sp.]
RRSQGRRSRPQRIAAISTATIARAAEPTAGGTPLPAVWAHPLAGDGSPPTEQRAPDAGARDTSPDPAGTPASYH